MTTAKEVEERVSNLQRAIGNRYKHLAEECPEAASYLYGKLEEVLLNHGFLTIVDLRRN